MASVSPMVIDGADERRSSTDGPDLKKKPLKRKRAEQFSSSVSSEEKQAKIDELRGEINSLFKFYRELVLANRGASFENVEKDGSCSASLNGLIACLLEESELPLSKLVDEIFEKVRGINVNGGSVSKASVKSVVLMIGQRLCYGVTNADADVLEDEDEFALWCWETRDLKLIQKSDRVSVKVRRTCRKKIQERISAVFATISALEKSKDNEKCQQDLVKVLEKLGKVLNESDIRLLVENMSQKTGAEMAEKEAKKEEKLLIKQMEKRRKEMEKERKEMDRELQKEKLQREKELKRLLDEAEKEEKLREKEESERRKQLKRQQEEAEKDKKLKEKEEAELKKQLAVKKQASIMERFLKRNKTNTVSQSDTSTINKITPSESLVERATRAMDSVLSLNAEIKAEDIWTSHLNSWRIVGRSNKKVHWGIRQKPKTQLVNELKLTKTKESSFDDESSIEKLVDGLVDCSGPLPDCQNRTQIKKLLQFDKSYRPAFYGVLTKKSQFVGARHPFAKDPEIDYEIDSDEEWEEDEPGESLSDCDKDVDEGTEKADDEDESEDGFFVPDGYLSENEGVQADEMESGEFVEEVKNLPKSDKKDQSEEFRTLHHHQKYLNNLTEYALKKNHPLIILNLMHQKTTFLSPEELTGTEKLERKCLQALSILSFPGFPIIKISNYNEEKNLEASSNKSNTTPLATTAAMTDLELPQIISIIQSSPYGIGKIVELLHDKFPAIPKSQLRNKVREIADFSENRWQVKKEILSKHGLSVSPEKNCVKGKSIATFFSKRCLPPTGKSMNSNQTSPSSAQKTAVIVQTPEGGSNESL